MPNELRTTLRFDLRDPPQDGTGSPAIYEERFHLDEFFSDQAAIGQHSTIVTVGFAAEEDMPVGDISVLGLLILRNLDATNFVTWGPKSGGVMVPLGRLKPQGEPAYIRLEPGITLTWQADTGDCKVKMLLLED